MKMKKMAKMTVSTQKFLCVIPLKVGLTCLGYFGVFGTIIQLLLVILLYFVGHCAYFVWPLHLCLYIFFVILSVILIIGLEQDKILLIRIYFCSLFTYILLMVLLLMIEMINSRNWIVFVLALETVILTACLFGVKVYLENHEKTVVNGEVFHAEYNRHPINPNMPHATAPLV